MLARLKFALIAGATGALFGGVIAIAVQKKDESFPWIILFSSICIFGVCGALAKRKWIDGVLEFFAHVLP